MKLKIFSNFRNPDTDPLFVHIKKKYSNFPITIFYEYFPKSLDELSINPYNFLILFEPNEFFGYHDIAIKNSKLFTAILSWSDEILTECSNGVLLTFNGRVLDDEFLKESQNNNKKFEVSFLCGDKNMSSGHILRHKVFILENEIKIPKKWYYVLDDYDHKNKCRPGYSDYSKDLSHIPNKIDSIGYGKRILYKESMFNVVIENVKHKNWYNKIGDNFLSKTVPIYWGCENIEDFGYDKRGIINFNNQNDLLEIINTLTPEKYNSMKPYIDYNCDIAKHDDLEDRIDEFLNSFIEINKID
jgi:hypothetical protein